MKRAAVNIRVLTVSAKPTGKYPKWCRAAQELEIWAPSLAAAALTTRTDEMLHTMHDTVTDRMRARMTEGASRVSVDEGRVVDER
jgi:hypothetical protein